MRVAVIFFGIARSVESTIASIRTHIYDCNPDVSLVTVASLNLPAVINSPRSGEVGLVPRHEEIFRLGAEFNVERSCDRNGLIVLHDAVPGNFEMTERERRTTLRRDKALADAWTGDVWRVLPILRRERPDLHIQILDCEPTGLVLVSNLDPKSRLLHDQLEAHVRILQDREAQEMDFWIFLASINLTDARAVQTVL